MTHLRSWHRCVGGEKVHWMVSNIHLSSVSALFWSGVWGRSTSRRGLQSVTGRHAHTHTFNLTLPVPLSVVLRSRKTTKNPEETPNGRAENFFTRVHVSWGHKTCSQSWSLGRLFFYLVWFSDRSNVQLCKISLPSHFLNKNVGLHQSHMPGRLQSSGAPVFRYLVGGGGAVPVNVVGT